MKPHKHAVVIRAFADGAQVQTRTIGNAVWNDTKYPDFADDQEYRIKPAATVVKTKMTEEDLLRIYRPAPVCGDGLYDVANAAIARAIDDGQVVTKELAEAALFKQGENLRSIAINQSNETRAARDLAVAVAVKVAVINAWVRTDSTNEYAAMYCVDLAAVIAGVKP